MLDWQIKTLAKKSAISGREIKPGDCVVCAVFVDELGNLDRIDVHKDEFDASKINGKVIGWWERVVSDAPDADEHLTSAYDIAIMSRELIVNHPDIKKFTTIWMDTVRNGAFGLSNTNKLVRFYSGATGLKTGFTAAAGYCLSATAQRDGMELIAVVMGAKTSGERNAACKALLDYGFANYSLIDPGLEAVPKVPVKLGSAQDVELELGENGNLLIDKGKKGTVTTEVRAEPFTTAPVAKGAKLGKLTIRSGDEILRELPLVAKEQVERVTFGQLFVKILRRVAMAKEVTA